MYCFLNNVFAVSEENIALNGRSAKWSVVHNFLVSAGVGEYVQKFIEQQVDLDALFMLDDQDLISLGLPLGPRKKLLKAIAERDTIKRVNGMDNESGKIVQ